MEECKLCTVEEDKQYANDFIENLYKFKREKAQDLSLMETIIEYAYFIDTPLQEVGNILADHQEFTNILEKKLVEERYIREDLPDQLNLEEW